MFENLGPLTGHFRPFPHRRSGTEGVAGETPIQVGRVTAFRRRERFNHSEGVVLGLKWLRYMTVTWILPG